MRLDDSPELLFALRNGDHSELITQAVAAENLEQSLASGTSDLAGNDLSELFGIELDVAPEWQDRLQAVTHVDGTARIQTVEADEDLLTANMLTEFEQHTGIPVVVNTSLNTAGRPIVDSPRDVLELFGSAPVDALAICPYLVRRP